MKQIISSLLFFTVILFSLNSCKKKIEYIEIPRIEYNVLINNQNNHYSWFDNIEGYQRTDFIETLIDEVEKHDATIEDRKNNKLDNQNTKSILIELLQTYSEQHNINIQDINGLRFREKWIINKSNGFIEKKVNAIGLIYYDKHILFGDSITQSNLLMWIILNNNKTMNPKLSKLTNAIAYDVPISFNNYSSLRSQNEKTPFYFENIEPSLRYQIVELLLKICFELKVPAYDYFFSELSKADISNIQEKNDTIQLTSFDNITDSVIVLKPNISMINKLKFVEKWEIDYSTLTFNKTVVAISPSEEMIDNYGNLRGYKPLFWLVYDKKTIEALSFN